ncbi:MAG: homocysteine S-methyltransferase family protein [Coprobacillaceae bacterium]
MLQEQIKNKTLVFDGAMGTQLQDSGLTIGEYPEALNITHPEVIQDIHLAYLKAGADFITTNTFGCNPLKMKDCPYSYQEMISAAIDNAYIARKKANRENDSYIVLDIGPIGQLLEPMGTLTFDEAYETIKAQVILAKDKVDVILLETMTDIYEVKAGVLAVKENSTLPVFVTMTYENNQRTLSGCDALTMVNVLEGLNVDVIGVNCSLGPIELTPIINEILQSSTVPVMLQPNAGLPQLVEGKTCFTMDADTFVKESIKHVENGVRIIGGCCGTTPAYIKMLVKQLPITPKTLSPTKMTRVSSGNQTVTFNHNVIVCGERLNPTGKKKLKAALLEERYDEIVKEAIVQEQAGAHVLDVNVGLPGIDECNVMKHVIKLLQEVINLPLQIDSSDIPTLEQACRYYNGKPLINSVNGKQESMDNIFPIVKKYGGVIIGLTLDENGIPDTAKKRVAIANKIISEAKKYGIDKQDIIIDCLVLTASAQQKEVIETLKAVSMMKELGIHTVLGVSNISFGLPNRPLLNKTFLSMALFAGLNLPIINPLDQELMATIDAFNVLSNQDMNASKYISKQAITTTIATKETKEFSLYDAIIHGLKEEAPKATKQLLETKDGLEVVNNIIIPALDDIGKQYENNTIFLPQLIQSAEVAKSAFTIIKESFSSTEASKGPIIMATVHGDIHDIGKNIVKVVLESYGYKVIDLGKDVPPKTIVDAYHKYQPKAIGLSALMTTTVVSMKKTISLLKENKDVCPIFVGGAVLTKEYAKQIHADYYSKDAMETVEIMNRIIQ